MVPGLLWLVDLRRPADEQLGVHVLVGGIRWYRANLSGPLDLTGARCRFRPTCSLYAEEAIRRHGAARGTTLAVGRMLRCGPWTDRGTVDPVPP